MHVRKIMRSAQSPLRPTEDNDTTQSDCLSDIHSIPKGVGNNHLIKVYDCGLSQDNEDQNN